MAIAAVLMAGLGLPSVREVEKLDPNQEEDEKKFLLTLAGATKDIWRRRIVKGLTESELQFIREKLYG